MSRVIVTDILRGELGFDGVVVSDDLEMQAIVARFEIGEAAVRFLEAGGDLILICRDTDRQRQAIAAVESAVRRGRLSRQRVQASLDRLDRLRRAIPPPTFSVSGDLPRSIVGSDAHRAVLARVLAASALHAGLSEDAAKPPKTS